ncbi:MAG: type IV pilus modification protein PilV [Gammaproteobacteria bacterium]|jgi:type IV pilus assembly protein PilV|nr:type IV pilus modification protein PilV [Gammaproteobacteria bacterium]MDH3751829.1 type IV pilus modification protein PilV [Gammaproteobacteria bacterium]MDH3805275.1 type IV pilus modification protein PilV [Gammaproteobacteria bacterium]
MLITHQKSAPRRQRGFSLVEVLIALVIMSVGMLGIAGLYVQSMQAGRTSMFRHHAVTLAGDVADRIRANPTALGVYTGGGADGGCVGLGVSCSQPQMAQHDIFLWSAQAAEMLPAGTVNVTLDAAVTPPEYTIAVRWVEAGENLDYTIIIPIRGL